MSFESRIRKKYKFFEVQGTFCT